MLALAIVIFILFFLLSRKNPLLSLVAACALLPTYLLRFDVLGLPATILEVIIWAIFFGWIISFKFRISDFKSISARLGKIKWPLALFFVSSLIAIIVSPEKIGALGIWRAYFLESILVFVMFLAVVKDREDLSKIIFGLSASALYLSLYAMGQRFFGLPIPEPWQKELRVTSLFPYPNAVGLYLAPIVLLMVGWIVENFKNKPLTAYCLLLTAALSSLAIVFAHSDGAILAIIISLFVLIIFNLLLDKKYKSGVVVVLLVFIAAGLLFGVLAPVKEKIFFRDWYGFVRLTMWRETWEMLKDNFIFGAGLAGYQTKILPYHESRDWMEVFLYPHNIILNFWSELGLLGLAAFVWLIEKFGRICYKIILAERQSRTYTIAALAAMAAILLHGLVDVPYFKNDLSILFWIIYAMPFAVKN